MRSSPAAPLALAAALALAFAACGGAKQSMRVQEQPVTSTDATPEPLLGARPDELRARIVELDEAITTDWPALGAPEPDDATVSSMSALPAASAAATCERSPRATCTDVCRLSDSICTNATTICDLASQLPGDDWAASKCNRAKASCKTASERCCAC